METQEASSAKIKDELELIGERAARIGGMARRYAELADGEDEVLYDALRNVAGALQLAITCLYLLDAQAEDRPAVAAPVAAPMAAPGAPPPPWAPEG